MTKTMRTVTTKVCIPMTLLLFMALSQACVPDYNYDHLEYFEGYPRLTNETIGKLNYFSFVLTEHPSADFAITDWGYYEGATGMFDMRQYFLGFEALAVMTAAEHTPAYRKPYVEILDATVLKFTANQIWEPYIQAIWGTPNPIHPINVMYTGHLQAAMAAHERLAGNGKYITNDVTLTTTDGTQTWTTNLYDLSADIHNLILTNKDSQDNNYYHIACMKDEETGEVLWVWPVCNAVPQLVFNLLPTQLGLDSQAVNAPYLEWVKENRVEPDDGYIRQLFTPDSDPPIMTYEKEGLYTAWTLLYHHPFDPEWVENVGYPKFVASVPDYVAPGVALTYYYDFPWEPVTDAGGTAFGMTLAKQMGDITTYQAYLNGLESLVGATEWRLGRPEQYGYFNWVPYPDDLPVPLFLVVPNMFSLWADVLSPETNLLTIAQSPRGPEFYEQPYLADVTNPGVFVNQAIWDDPILYITINGAHVTSANTHLVVRNLKADRTYQVLLNDEVYDEWTVSEGEMTITTPPLSSVTLLDTLLGTNSVETQRFQIIEQPAA